MKTLSATAQAAQDAARQTTGEFGTQTHTDPGIVFVGDVPVDHDYLYGTPTGTWWVREQHEDSVDTFVGPFTDQNRATVCMNESFLIQSLEEEGSIECESTDTQPQDGDEVLWLTDDDHRELTDDDHRELTAHLAVDDLEHIEHLAIPLDDYAGQAGSQMTVEIDQVAQAIIRVEGPNALNPLFVTFPGDITTNTGQYLVDQEPSIGFTHNGFTITQPLNIFDLVDQDEAYGSQPQARAIAAGLISIRDQMVVDYHTKMGL